MNIRNSHPHFVALIGGLALTASLAIVHAQNPAIISPARSNHPGSIGASSAAASLAANVQALVAANNAFAFKLVGELIQSQPDANLFISPYTVASGLQTVGAGAAGQTTTEIQQLLGIGLPATSLDPAFKALNRQLAGRSGMTLILANSLWYDHSLQLKSAFVSANQFYFQAGLAAVDFRKLQTARLMNLWASRMTQGNAQNIAQFPFPPGTQLVLANASYFKGKWVTPFDPNATQIGDFYLANGHTQPAPMMSQTGTFAYGETMDFQALELPYNGGLQMELFLPAPNVTLQTVLADLAGPGEWASIQNNFGQASIVIILPKFSLNYGGTLNDPLAALGLVSAFGTSANFSGITAQPLKIDQVQQNSCVVVAEQGTVAVGSTTTSSMSETSVDTGFTLGEIPNYPLTMNLNRPFFFVISDVNTGSILFTGVVNDPAAGN